MFDPWKKSCDKPRQCIEKSPLSQSYSFPSSFVWLWELDHKEGWVLKNWCFLTAVLEKTLASPLDCKEINQSILKELSAEHSLEGLKLKLLYVTPPDVKNWLSGKDPDVGEDWRREEKGMIEDEMVGWHHRLYGHEFEQALGVVMDREAWCAAVHVVTDSWTLLGWIKVLG